ncbi:MAG: winged helix-turn-helix transcriptional regulator [Clostridiales bacterium]|jgi:ArsR family transcriptional regulator|nr:winged helix-turn-helix transcriptional regulator [Clostridiales bacterium]
MKKETYGQYVALFKALSEETRLRIVELLCEGERCGCHLLQEVKITQPTLSYHMKILTGCSLVIGRRDGAWVYYRLNPDQLSVIREFCQDLSSACQESAIQHERSALQ